MRKKQDSKLTYTVADPVWVHLNLQHLQNSHKTALHLKSAGTQQPIG